MGKNKELFNYQDLIEVKQNAPKGMKLSKFSGVNTVRRTYFQKVSTEAETGISLTGLFFKIRMALSIGNKIEETKTINYEFESDTQKNQP